MTDFRSVICGDNLCNRRLYPSHTITAEEEPTGFEAFRVGRSSRDELTNYATATTAASDWWLRVVFDRVRAFNFLAIDRGHNLAGKTVRLKVTSDATDFTGTYQTVHDALLPVYSAPGHIDDPLGTRTEEGAWVRRTPLYAGKAIELFIPAGGAGFLPKVVGLYVGLSWSPARPNDLPWEDDADTFVTETVDTPALWSGRGELGNRRDVIMGIRLQSPIDYDAARLHVVGIFGRGTPIWFVPNEVEAHHAMMVVRPSGSKLSFRYEEDWWAFRKASVPAEEWEPKN